jgi:acetyl esterase/lipase
LTSDDVLSRPAPPPDLTICYGSGPEHVADVRLPPRTDGVRPAGPVRQPAGPVRQPAGPVRQPAGPVGQPATPAPPGPPRGAARPAPLVVFLHGGFWRASFDRTHTGPLAAALAAAGFAVCVPEYRRTGQRGGGWRGTFDDVAAAVDAVPALIREAVGADRVSEEPALLAGHSAGGHLALWAAARHRLPPDTGWRAPGPRFRGVVALAAVSDLSVCHALGLGRGAVDALLGGGPDRHPERYRAADPMLLLPVDCPVRLVHGSADDTVPCGMSRDYLGRARAAGDDVALDALPGAGHFDVIDPLSSWWPRVQAAFADLAPP